MGVVYDQPVVDGICTRLREFIQDALQKHLYSTAIFYADKLTSLSHQVEDIYTLAECYFRNGEYRRVLHLLLKKNARLTKEDVRLKLIAAQSFMECKEWEECLSYLEDHSPALASSTGDPPMLEAAVADATAEECRTAATFALLRGRVYEVTENQENALYWYTRAARLDPYCFEALDRLIGNYFLTLDQEVALLTGLRLHSKDEWLRHIYAAKLAGARCSGSNPLEPTAGAVAAAAGAGTGGTGEAASAAGPEGFLGGTRIPGASPTSCGQVGGSVGDVQASSAGAWWGAGRRRRLRQAVDGERSITEAYPAPLLPAALVQNGYTLAAQSTRYFYEGDYESSYLASKGVLEDDPYHLATLPVHVASLVMLDMRSVVFYVAHQLMSAYPSCSVAWFTAGCYYYMIRKYEHARRFFHKAVALDRNFAPAWIGYGHAFAHQDESDQALAAYRTASRLFPGSHLPWLFIGMEYVRTNSLLLAQQCLETARTKMPTDPHVYNEIAVVAFHNKNYSLACDLLLQALQFSSAPHDAVAANLGHAFLKCGVCDRALEAFQQANGLNPRSAPVLSGIAFTLQLLGRPEEAIEYYHRALSLQRDDAFSAEMLSCAVQEAADQPISMELC